MGLWPKRRTLAQPAPVSGTLLGTLQAVHNISLNHVLPTSRRVRAPVIMIYTRDHACYDFL